MKQVKFISLSFIVLWTTIVVKLILLSRLCLKLQDLDWREKLALQNVKSLFSREASLFIGTSMLAYLAIVEFDFVFGFLIVTWLSNYNMCYRLLM